MDFPTEQILSFLPDALLLLRTNETVAFLNASAERLLRLPANQVLDRTITDLLPFNPQFCERCRLSLKTGRGFTVYEDVLIIRSEKRTVETYLEPFYDPAGTIQGIQILLRDLTSLEKMKEDLRHADRLALMGTIASGLAHEIKNPLGGIRGAAQMVLREITSADHQEYLRMIIQETDRVSELISELLHFSKPRKPKFGTVNLNKLLDDILILEENKEINSGVRWIRNYDPSLPKIRADGDQLKQVFLNLLQNARDAIAKKGKIEITTRVVTDYQLKATRGGMVPLLVVEISDNGRGMGEETLKHLFTPFYTTKKGGTGLGLAICHRFVHEHRGFIEVTSAVKKGTTFRVFLRGFSIPQLRN